MTKTASLSGARPALHENKRARGPRKQASTQPSAASVSGAPCQSRLTSRLLAEIAARSRKIAKASSMTAQWKARLKHEIKGSSRLLEVRQNQITDVHGELSALQRFECCLPGQIACSADHVRYASIHCCMHNNNNNNLQVCQPMLGTY